MRYWLGMWRGNRAEEAAVEEERGRWSGRRSWGLTG